MAQRFTSLHPQADLPRLTAILGSRPTNGLSSQRGWYTITALADSRVEVSIYDEIGGYGVRASDFIKDFSGIKASAIDIRVNSPGGDVFDGIAIHNAIRRHPATCTAYVDGLAASAASFICMAADRVVMSPHSQMMIHEASGLVIGNAADMRQMADILDKSSDNIASIYAERAGGTVAEWRQRMREEIWLSDHEAVSLGLADAIDGQEPRPKNTVNTPAAATMPAVDFTRLFNQLQEEAALAV